MRHSLPPFIKVWFALDLFLALFPPLHWGLSRSEPVFGIPAALLYLLGLSLFIAGSVVVAYFSDDSLDPNQDRYSTGKSLLLDSDNRRACL